MTVIHAVNDFAVYNAMILANRLEPIYKGTCEAPFCFDESCISLAQAVAEAYLQAGARLSGTVYFKFRGKTIILTLGEYFRLNNARIYYLREYITSKSSAAVFNPANGIFTGDAPGFGSILFSLITKSD